MKIDILLAIEAIIDISKLYDKYDVENYTPDFIKFAEETAEILIDLFKGAEK